MIDDHRHWKGAKEAVGEYARDHRFTLFLAPIDYTARLAVKPDSSSLP